MKYILRNLTIALVCTLSIVNGILAQPYVEGGNTRHRFAQSYIGTQLRYQPGMGSYLASNINEDRTVLRSGLQSCIAIGGTHFWGHADFYIHIPLYGWAKSEYKPQVETGARVFLWRIEKNKFRPFVGALWMPSVVQISDGAQYEKHEFPVTAGWVYMRRNVLLECSFSYSFSRKNSYFENITQPADLLTPPLQFSLGIKWLIDGTVSAEPDWQSGRTQFLTDTLTRLGRLNSFTFSIGLSSAFYLKKSNHISELNPFLHQHRFTNVFPEIGIGYYRNKTDIQFNLTFRTTRSNKKAFGNQQIAKRTALSFEAYKFFTDYHGFALFAGPVLSTEWLSIKDIRPDKVPFKYNTMILRPGLVVGWDIRPNKLQVFYLRTNLRWIPNLNLSTAAGNTFSFDQLEINFIQLVIMLDRIKM